MRNKFTELVNNGVASFDPQPVAEPVPVLDRLVRLYNAFWGVASGTHMSLVDGRYIITGKILKDPNTWTQLFYNTTYNGVKFSQSGYYSFSEVLYSYGLTGQKINMNGDIAIELVPDPEAQAMCTMGYQYGCCPCESKLPISISFFGDSHVLNEAFNSSSSLRQLAQSFNENPRIRGDRWHVYKENLLCVIGDKTYLLEVSGNKGTKIELDPELQGLLEKEGIPELYLVQYKNFFKVDSDDKAWKGVLAKCKFNSIRAKDYKELTPVEWFEEIKAIITTIS